MQPLARHAHACTDRCGRFPRSSSELDCARTRHRDDEIEPVKECARELVAVARQSLRGTRALDVRIATRSTGTQVHRSDELEGRREANIARGTGDADDTVLQRLPERLERRPLELRQLVEQPPAAMREAGLARTQTRPTTDDRRRRGAVMRSAKRWLRDQRTVWIEQTGD